MEGEKMVRKSKVGSTGRFGARYGRKAKRTVRPRDTCPLICLILASYSARYLPTHLPDTRQLSRATPARSSA